MSITIRQYHPSDVADLVALFRSSVHRIAARDYSESQLRAWAPDVIDHELFARRSAAKSTWIAECEGKIAGFTDLSGDGHIDMLFVHPDFARRGVARALLTKVEDAARQRSIPRLYTEASITARPAFEALGFQVLRSQSVTLRGESLVNYRMEKTLDRIERGAVSESPAK